MSKAWAKMVVYPENTYWSVELRTDLGNQWIMAITQKRKALASARAWSRRLGNIPVEIGDE